MSGNKKNVPQRRFKEFENAEGWEQRELGKLTDVYDGTHQTPNYTDSGVMFLSVENIKTLQSEKFISEEDFEKDFAIYPEKGDVLMTRIGDIGTANVVESDAPKAYYVSLALLKQKELNPYFLKESISSKAVKKELWKRTLHIAFPKKINKNEIANVIVPYPVSEGEQRRIGELFQSFNNLINLHQRKLDKIKVLKEAYLTEMFPAEGERKPKLRFAGFTDDWEQRDLGDISDVTKLAGFEFTEYVIYSDEGTIIALRGLNVKNGKIILDDVKYIDQSDFSKLNRSKLFKDDILFTYVGTVGELAIIPADNKYYLAPNVARIRLEKEINSQFVIQMMGNKTYYDKVIFPLIATSSQPALSMENVRKFILKLPSFEEQTKIGEFFVQLDNLITLHQRKLEKLQNIKKAYLNEMFI